MGLGRVPSGIIGLLIWGFGMVLLARVERIKKEHDLVTYHEILAYSKGEPVDRSNPRSQRARRHPVLRGVILTLVSAIVGASPDTLSTSSASSDSERANDLHKPSTCFVDAFIYDYFNNGQKAPLFFMFL